MDDNLPTESDLAEIKGALLDVVKHGQFLAKATLLASPPKFSDAHARLSDPINIAPVWRERYPVPLAHTDIAVAILTGLDHLAGFASLAANAHPSAPAMATVTRGAIEVFARAHWLLRASDIRDMVARHTAITLRDLKFPVKFGQEMQAGSKEVITATDHRDAIELFKTREQLPSVPVPGITDMTVALIDDTFGKGRGYYSQLSGVAHGESFAINMFLQLNNSSPDGAHPDNISLQIPKQLAIGYAEAMVETAREVIEDLACQMQPPTNTVERWQEAIKRSWLRLAQIDDLPGELPEFPPSKYLI